METGIANRLVKEGTGDLDEIPILHLTGWSVSDIQIMHMKVSDNLDLHDVFGLPPGESCGGFVFGALRKACWERKGRAPKTRIIALLSDIDNLSKWKVGAGFAAFLDKRLATAGLNV